MTGFIRGLFGRKNQQTRAAQPKQTGAFFLNEDDAKTFGDIDYMRSNKVVKRTFARKRGAEEMESVRQISAMEMSELDEKGIVSQPKKAASSSSSLQSTPQASKSESPRRSTNTDTSMDMFRNMAKDIKKR
ncbi:MAG: hypothetical protein AAF773_04685 [Cyanobacteria bacterium P01_D01_bin.115]